MEGTTHLVIARYNEDLTWVPPVDTILSKFTSLRTFIYNKGSEFNLLTTLRGLPALVENLANEKRDGGTLLHHLATRNHLGLLPTQVIFLQGDPWPHLPPGVNDVRQPQFLPYYLAGWPNEYVYLNGVLECDWDGKPHHMWNLDLQKAWVRIAHIAYKYGMDFDNLPRVIRFSPGMSQIIPRICMEAPVQFWLDVDDWLGEHDDHGFELERLWFLLFSNIRKHNEQHSEKRDATSEHSGHQ